MDHFRSPTKIELHEGDAPGKASGDVAQAAAAPADELQAKLDAADLRYLKLLEEQQRLKIALEVERGNVIRLEIEVRALGEALKRAKPATGGVQTADEAVQTWRGMLCRACIETEKVRCEMARLQDLQKNCIVIQPEQLEKMRSSIDLLKKYSSDGKVAMPPYQVIYTSVGLDEKQMNIINQRRRMQVTAMKKCGICGRGSAASVVREQPAERVRRCFYGRGGGSQPFL